MSNTIKLKRGSGSDPSASDLVVGELAIRTDNGKIFTKKDNGSVAEISGSGGGNPLTDGDKGDITVSNGGDTFTIDSGVVTSAKIADGTIVNADINASAAIAGSKINPTFTSDITINESHPSIFFNDSGDNPDYELGNHDGTFVIQDDTAGANRLTIDSSKIVSLINHDFSAGIDVTGDISATGDLTVSGGEMTLNGTSCLLNFNDTNNNPDFRIQVESGFFIIEDATNSYADRFVIASDGTVGINGNLDVGAGIDVVGDITGTGDLTLTSTDAGSSASPIIELYRNSASPADADYLGQFKFTGESDDGSKEVYAKITGKIDDASSGTEDGLIEFALRKAGSNNIGARLTSTDLKLINGTGLEVAGNISCDGTVDGVDIAARDTLFGGLTSSSGVLSNGVTATTQSAGNSTTRVATTAFVSTAIANLVDSAPSTLDTLNELAAALGDDANFSTTVTNSLATKLPLAGGTLSGDLTVDGVVVAGSTTNLPTLSSNGLVVASLSGNNNFVDLTILGGRTGRSMIKFGDQDSQNVGSVEYSHSNNSIQFFTNGSTTSHLTIASNGAISVSGTVDGRDLATDGTKLDGIESNATADQTASEILTLIKTVDGSGSGLDADTLDGVSSASFLRSDADDSFSGTITANSDATNPIIKVQGAGPNFIQFATDSSGTVDADSINLIYRTSPNTLAFERASDAQVMFSVDADDQQAIFAGNLDVGAGLDVTGNISVSGTVDGRDVASDGSKLDGIESGATADQSNSEIKTAYEANSNTNAFTDALLSKLNGIAASATNVTNNNQLTNGAGYITATLTNEQVQDIVGGMVSSNTESGITVTYQDSDGTLDFSVASQTDNNFTNADHSKLDGIESGATADMSNSEIKTAYEANSNTNAFTDALLSKLNGIAASATNVTNTNQLTNGAGFITATLTNEQVQDIVGGMVSGNTESGITVTYQDSDGTLDFAVGTLNQNTTGNAATATQLANARTIAGVSFNGTANISLNNNAITNGAGYITSSGTSAACSGNAATATKLATARTIAGVSFDGSANISLNNNGITNGAGYVTSSVINSLNASNLSSGTIPDARFPSTLPAVDGSNLTGISAGATGGGSDEVFYENDQTVTTNYTITNGKNAMAAGPISINSGVTVTVGSGETLTIV